MERLILLIGIAVILGSIGGRIFARLRIPQVVGYIVIGILAILVGMIEQRRIRQVLSREIIRRTREET